MSTSSRSNSASSGSTTLGLLGIAFIVLKLTHVIAWSWWWVTAPFWGGLALAIVIGIIGLVVIAIMGIRRRRR